MPLGTSPRGKGPRRSRIRRFSRRVRKKRKARPPVSTRVPQTVHQAPAAFQEARPCSQRQRQSQPGREA
jgi:hypothetical protein